jgi:CheY-like chemotaxis protein/signal transduction histidine kinase
MLAKFFNRIISYGIVDTMDQGHVNRVKRINIFYLILFILMFISVLTAIVTGKPLLLIRDGGIFIGTLLIYFLVPASRKPDLNSLLGLIILALLFLSAFIMDFRVDSSLILAFYLLFPFAAVSVNKKHGLYISMGLGATILTLNSIPGIKTFIHLEVFDMALFTATYIIILFLCQFIEQSNRQLVSRLKDSSSQFKDQVVERDEFISKLSHKLRTSLSNITLINNLVNDSRLTSQQKELMETLKASTNDLIDDVNNIVEIASPGILDYKKSIISFNIFGVMDEAVEIISSGSSSYGEVSLEYSGQISQLLIGDPSLLRSLVINIIKGLSLYKQTENPVIVRIETLRETPNQVRLEFRFKILTELGEDLSSHMNDLKRGNSQKRSNLATAYKLLQESESELMASYEQHGATISFFQDFAKDATRSVPDIEEVRIKQKKIRKSVTMAETRVLLVEDNEINQKIVLLSLNKKVQQIDVAGNGKIALEMFGLKQYDIILMDIMMPVMDGLTAIKKIREIESTNDSHVPIITITANALTGDRDNCLAAGADDYIAKPFQADMLVKKMKNLLA